jgi:hypothetical protein
MTVDHEGDELRGQVHPLDRFAREGASTCGEPTMSAPSDNKACRCAGCSERVESDAAALSAAALSPRAQQKR